MASDESHHLTTPFCREAFRVVVNSTTLVGAVCAVKQAVFGIDSEMLRLMIYFLFDGLLDSAFLFAEGFI